MTDAEMQREIERAQRNTRKLRALQAENEHTAATVAAVLEGKPPQAPTHRVERRNPAAVRV